MSSECDGNRAILTLTSSACLCRRCRRLAEHDLDAIVLIGSNDGQTQSSAIRQLIDLLGLPRANALLGVVSYANAFYHPKTIHLSYRDGREVAYVGSANLTPRGINGRNVEAGIVFDAADGDPVDVLSRIKRAPRHWFDSHSDGLFKVTSQDDVNRLEAHGILTTTPATSQPTPFCYFSRRSASTSPSHPRTSTGDRS